MEHLAEALIRATQYIDERTDEHTADDDVKQLEDIAHVLSRCTEHEKQLLITVAKSLGLPNWPGYVGIES